MDSYNFHLLLQQYYGKNLKLFIEQYSNLSITDIKQNKNLDIFQQYVINELHPKPNILKTYIESNHCPQLTSALRIKLQAITRTANTIEKTMSPEQLFRSNNALWALDYTIAQIHDIHSSYKELSKEIYDKIKENHSDVVHYLFKHANNSHHFDSNLAVHYCQEALQNITKVIHQPNTRNHTKGII